MTFKSFAEANRQRCESRDGFNHPLAAWSTSDWFTAVMGELGEAANVAKKLNRVRDGVPGNKESADALRDKLRRELGDVFVYLDLLAQSLGFSIADAAVDVFDAKSREIGYPKTFRESATSSDARLTDSESGKADGSATNQSSSDLAAALRAVPVQPQQEQDESKKTILRAIHQR